MPNSFRRRGRHGTVSTMPTFSATATAIHRFNGKKGSDYLETEFGRDMETRTQALDMILVQFTLSAQNF